MGDFSFYEKDSVRFPIYKGSLYFDSFENHSLYVSVGNVSTFAGAVYTQTNRLKLGFDLSASVVDVGYDGRVIDAGISFLTIGVVFQLDNGKFTSGINCGWFGTSISVDFVELWNLLFGG